MSVIHLTAARFSALAGRMPCRNRPDEWSVLPQADPDSDRHTQNAVQACLGWLPGMGMAADRSCSDGNGSGRPSIHVTISHGACRPRCGHRPTPDRATVPHRALWASQLSTEPKNGIAAGHLNRLSGHASGMDATRSSIADIFTSSPNTVPADAPGSLQTMGAVGASAGNPSQVILVSHQCGF